jgi:hypothetical protein
MYYDEEWKYQTTKNFLKTCDESLIPKKAMPIFSIMLNRTEFINAAKITIGNKDMPIVFDSSVDVMMMPTSHPPLLSYLCGQ